MRIIKRALIFFIFLALCLGGLVYWMAGGVQSAKIFDLSPRTIAEVPESGLTNTSTIVVVTWNIAWGRGWGSEGKGGAKPPEHFEASLKRIGRTLAEAKADIAILQEVDFDSTRSRRMDQAEKIAKYAGLRYVADAPSWEANWVPFPYWPVSEHFGHMRSGGAILSRFPLVSNTVQWLSKPAANPFWYNLFYLFRYVQTVELRLGDAPVRLLNTHTEAFDAQNRMEQAKLLYEIASASKAPLTIFAGDFNSTPPEATVRSGFPDEPETSHEGDATLATIRQAENLKSVITPEAFLANEKAYFTFPAHEPNRTLDYMFVGSGFQVIEARVLTEAGDVSDHLPIISRLRIVR